MNIVWVTPVVPYPPRDGGAIRIFQLAKRLARRHELRVLALGDADADARTALTALGMAVETFPFPDRRAARWSPPWLRAQVASARDPGYYYYQPRIDGRLAELVHAGAADVVLLETLKMHPYGAALRGIRTVLSRQNYEPDIARRIAAILPLSREKVLWRLSASLGASAERRICRAFGFITAVSERDADIFRRLAPRADIAVVPNGADLERFTPAADAEREGAVALSGLMSYLPNRDSALFFAHAVWPRVRAACPGATFRVLGHQAVFALPELREIAGVELCEPGDGMVDALRAASVVVVPLRAGGGTRIKVLEALALGKAVVSTSIGAEGLEVMSGRDLVLADAPGDFARAVIETLSDPERRRELGQNGRKLVEARYGWDRAADALEAFCARIGESAE